MKSVLFVLFLSIVDLISVKPIQDPVYFTVKTVVDGDTFHVYQKNGKYERVRLIGLDAPEIHDSEHKKGGYYGKEAKMYLNKLINGKKIRLVYDELHYDRYGRTLAYAYLPDGTFINAKLIINGYAQILTIQPNSKYASYFLKLQKEARDKRLGLWAKR